MRPLLSIASLAIACSAFAQTDVSPEDVSLHGQATYVAQHKPAFDALYSGPNSLGAEAAHSYSFSTTLFLGKRLWQGGEGYANLEGVQGLPFSNMSGLGGFTNGELQKTAGRELKWYRARLFVRQSIGFGGGSESVEPDKNQLGGAVDKRRLVITVGNLAVSDLFDNNRFAHDPRGDFLNWALMSSGAYDFAADARGYTWGIAAEWHDVDWSVRAGRFMMPKESNGLPLDPRLLEHFGDQIEFERSIRLGDHDGKIRLLGYHNVAVMGRFRDAIDLKLRTGAPPDLTLVRRKNDKWGLTLNAEQEFTPHIAGFVRASWNNGETETFAFTEIDRSIALGTTIGGAGWAREKDSLGIAFIRNGVSAAHRDYLAAGGLGFFLGDGRLNYRPEQIIEGYYSIALGKWVMVSADAQRIQNPGYNADRGPALFYGIRLHAEF